MKDSTKKWLTITGGLVICAILVFVISQQFTKDKPTDDLPPVNSSQQGEVVVDPDGSIPTTDPDASSDINENDLTVNPQTPSNDTSSNAGNGAVSSGTEQTIQADPEVPEEPDEETMKSVSQSAAFRRMPLYPADGSVQRIDDRIVVKIQKEYTPKSGYELAYENRS